MFLIIIIGEKAEGNCRFDTVGVPRINLPPFYYKKFSNPQISHFEKIIERKNGSLSFAERGCVRAHWAAFEYIIENNVDCCLVLEDDAMFSKFGSPKNLIQAYERFITSKQDIGIVGVSRLNDLNIKYFNFKYSNNLLFSKKYTFLENKNLNYCGTVGYFIRKKSCELLMEFFDEPLWRADNWDVYRSLGLKVAFYDPILIIEDTRQSTVSNPHDLMNSLFKRHGVLLEIMHFIYIKLRSFILK